MRLISWSFGRYFGDFIGCPRTADADCTSDTDFPSNTSDRSFGGGTIPGVNVSWYGNVLKEFELIVMTTSKTANALADAPIIFLLFISSPMSNLTGQFLCRVVYAMTIQSLYHNQYDNSQNLQRHRCYHKLMTNYSRPLLTYTNLFVKWFFWTVTSPNVIS